MVTGIDKILIIGLIIVLITPSTIATTVATHHGVMSTLSIRNAVIRTATVDRISLASIYLLVMGYRLWVIEVRGLEVEDREL